MDSAPLLILGSGGHAKSLIDAIEHQGKYRIAGLVSLNQSDSYRKYHVIGCDDDLESLFDQGIRCAAIGIGFLGAGNLRERLAQKLKSIGFFLPPIIDPSAAIADDVEIGEGTFIGKRAILNSGACIGDFSIVNSGAIVEHDTCISDYCHVAPGAVLCGEVALEACSFVGAGSVVLPQLSIGDHSIVGAGSVVLKNIPPHEVWVGNPAEMMRENR